MTYNILCAIIHFAKRDESNMSKVKNFKSWVNLLKNFSNGIILSTMVLSNGVSSFEFFEEKDNNYQYIENNVSYKISDARIKTVENHEKLLNFIYGKNIDAYNNLISNCSNLIKEGNFTNPVQCMGAFCYILNNGYLSSEKKYGYSYDVVKNRLITNLNGTSIMAGCGNCENSAVLFAEVLKEYGYNAYCGINYFDFDSFDYDFDAIEKYKNTYELLETHLENKFNDEENILFQSFLGLDVFSTFCYDMFSNESNNHASTIVVDSQNSYLLDPTNFVSFDLVSDESGDLKVNDSCYTEDVDLSKTYSLGYLSKNNVMNIIEGVQKDQGFLTKDYSMDFEIGVTWVSENRDMLEKFYEDNKKNLDLASKLYDVTKMGCYSERGIIAINWLSLLSLLFLQKKKNNDKNKSLKLSK